MSPKLPILFPGILSLFILFGQFFPLHPLWNPVDQAPAAEYSLHLPLNYVLTSPFSAVADWVTFNSARQDKVLILYIALFYWVFYLLRGRPKRFIFQTQGSIRTRRLKAVAGYLAYLFGFALFLAWAILIPRSSARLNPPGRDDLVIDFHSHTHRSHDGRRVLGEFTPEANMDWHRRMGFSAAFITDHNRMEGSQKAKKIADTLWQTDGYRSLEGEEVSLHDAHFGVLGNKSKIDNTLYDKNLAGVFRFLKEEPELRGGLAVVNLPEYWLHYPKKVWEQWVRAGAKGFEILNSVPVALDFPAEIRTDIVKLCRENHLFFYGVSDNHGWGNADYVWNILHIPGQARMGPDELQAAVLSHLTREGPNAVRVVSRTKLEPSRSYWIALDPILGLWNLVRTFSLAQALASLAWIWGLSAVFSILDLFELI